MKEVDLRSLNEEQKRALLADLKRIDDAAKHNRLLTYKPHPFQHEFHEAGRSRRFRMLMAPNRSGKTYSAAMEMAMHLTGRYPKGWAGKKFTGAIQAWCAGVTYEQQREAAQALLLGGAETGTGAIPANDIIQTFSRPGAPGSVGMVTVKHLSGGISTLSFKAYNQGREALQGASLDLLWMDEEPSLSEQEGGVVSELITRLRDRKGSLMITYTPLEGETPLTLEYYPVPMDPVTKKPDMVLRHLTQAGASDMPHMADQVDDIKREYPKAHEWRARIHGLPALGKGAIFPFTEDYYVIPGLALPSHTRYIFGMDYGIDHPTAVILMGWVEDIDTVYVVSEYTLRGDDLPPDVSMPPVVAAHMNRLLPGCPVAWPHDMSSREKGSGKTGYVHYKDLVNMLPEHAQYDDERKNGLEDSIDDIRGRIETGRFKVFGHCTKLIGEMQTYHRRKNKPVDIKDDLIAASRYAVMMLRKSRTTRRIGERVTGLQNAAERGSTPWFMDEQPQSAPLAPRAGSLAAQYGGFKVG